MLIGHSLQCYRAGRAACKAGGRRKVHRADVPAHGAASSAGNPLPQVPTHVSIQMHQLLELHHSHTIPRETKALPSDQSGVCKRYPPPMTGFLCTYINVFCCPQRRHVGGGVHAQPAGAAARAAAGGRYPGVAHDLQLRARAAIGHAQGDKPLKRQLHESPLIS